MKKIILITFFFLLAFIGFYLYLEYKKVEDFKNEVVEHLNHEGFTREDYSTPEYVKREVMKGYKLETIEIRFDSEKEYTYSYARTDDGIQLSAVFKNDTNERDYDKKEPVK